jgi:2-polyprenyl-3-methyl-5-hydroxy-6-metoxy-1,4-benzoquinol methylase
MENKFQETNRFDILAKEWDSKPARVEGAMTFVDKICEIVDQDIKEFSLLDYGSGSGLVSFGFANKVNSISGFDNSKGMVEVYNEKAKNIGLDNISAKVHDANLDKFPIEEFELITTNMTMHHIKDVKKFVKNLTLSLKDEGYLFIADLVTEDGTFHSDNNGVEHFGFDIQEVESIFCEAGLKDVNVEVFHTIDKPQKSYDIFIASGIKR